MRSHAGEAWERGETRQIPRIRAVGNMEAKMMPERPANVTLAVYMLYLSLGIGLIRLVVTWLLVGAPGWIAYTMLAKLLIIMPITMWLYYMIGKGKNWARIIVLILVILETPLSIYAVVSFGHFPGLNFWEFLTNLEVVQTFIKIVAMVLLYRRDSSDWFSAIKHVQPLPVSKHEEKIADISWPGQKDVEDLVARIKGELAEGTGKGTIRRTLVKNGWDNEEASQFVKQIAYELTTNPKDVQLIIERYQRYMLYGGLATILGLIALFSGVQGFTRWGSYALLGSIVVVWGFFGWVTYHGRLKRSTPANTAITFRPSKGSLHFSKKSLSPVSIFLIVFVLIFAIFILGLAIAPHFIK